MINSPTLDTLSIADLSQRYLQSLINYDGKIWWVANIEMGIKKPIFTLYDPLEKGFNELIDGGGGLRAKPINYVPDRDGQLLKSKLYWEVQIDKYNLYLEENPLLPQWDKEAIVLQIKGFERTLKEVNDEIAQRAKVVKPVVMEKVVVEEKPQGPQKMTLDFSKLNIERPRSGYYPFKDSAIYLSYSAEKQFCRGFSLRANCWAYHVHNLAKATISEFAELLTAAFFGPKVKRTPVTSKAVLAMKSEVMVLSPQIVALKGTKYTSILYRKVAIANVDSKGINLLVPHFSDELSEVLVDYKASVRTAPEGSHAYF